MAKYKYIIILFLYETRIFETSDLIMFANCPVAKLYGLEESTLVI